MAFWCGCALADAYGREHPVWLLNNLLRACEEAADFLARKSACSQSSGKKINLESLCLCLRLTGFL